MVTTIYWSNPTATLHVGDARDVLAAMPDGSADCIVTSPPYWAKRDYGVAGPVRPRARPGRLRRHPARRLPRGAPRPGRRRNLLAQPRRLLLRRQRRPERAARLPRPRPGRAGTRPAWPPRTCSACPGGSPSPCRTTAGSSATRSSGTSPTPCPSRSATGSTAGTN